MISVILDFGECQFKFDIRKLQDLRTFLKHWYRQKLIKQAFIAADPEMDPNDFNLNGFDDGAMNQEGTTSDDANVFEDGTRVHNEASSSRSRHGAARLSNNSPGSVSFISSLITFSVTATYFPTQKYVEV